MASKVMEEGRAKLRSAKQEKQSYKGQDYTDSVYIIEGYSYRGLYSYKQ